MAQPPVDEAVSDSGQWIMTILVFAALAFLIVAAYRLGRTHGTPIPGVLLGGGLLAGFIEPMYCSALNLWYYQPGQWTMFSAFGNEVPIWVWFSYGAFYGGLGLLIWWRVEVGATRAELAKLSGVLFLVGVATEIVCIQLGTYEYFGPHPFRIADFPVWIAVANATIGLVIGVAAARLRPHLPGYQVVSMVALVPAVMTSVQFGTGFLMADAINSSDPSDALLYPLAIVSMGLAAILGWWALKLVPAGGGAETAPAADSAAVTAS